MPDYNAKRGDIYLVHRVAISSSNRDPKPKRPMVCVAERPRDDFAWQAMPRLTSNPAENDLSSEPDDNLGLSKPGWWSWRYLHSVRKRVTGKADCRYKGTLLEPEHSRVLDHYKNRPKSE